MSRWGTVPNARRCGGIAACESLGNVLMSRAVFNKRIAEMRAAAEVKYFLKLGLRSPCRVGISGSLQALLR
jgi:hypothetical protein